MNFDQANKTVALKLEAEKERLENYNIVDGFAFYRGSPVDYSLIKVKFEERVKRLVEKEDEGLTKGEDVKDDKEEKTETKKIEKLVEGGTTDEEAPKEKVEITTTTTATTTTTTTSSTPTIQFLKETKSIAGFITKIESPAARIGIFLNLNGTSKTRKNVMFLNKKAFKIDELTQALLLEDKTKGDKEKTDRNKITVERIQACYAEETRLFLIKNPPLTKFQKLGQFGFTKSFYCYEVATDRKVAKQIYSELLIFVKTWTGRGNPKRFAEKMKKYYQTVLNQFVDVFEEVEQEYAQKGIFFT